MSEIMQEYLSNAEIAFTNSQYEAALEWCGKAIAQSPSNSDAYTGAGKACLVLNKLPEAEQYLQKAVEYDETNGEKYFDLGNIKFGVEKYAEALANYAKAEQLDCRDEVRQKLYYQIGMISHMTGDAKSALLNFEKAENIGAVNADTKEILLKRIQIYIESEDYGSAENYAIQLKMLAPGEFRSYQIYFQILVAMGKYDKAEELLNEAEQYSDMEADVQNKADVCFDKAVIYAAKADKDPENAAIHYQSALEVLDEFLATPDLPQEVTTNVNFSKAEIFLKLEKFDEALNCVNGIADHEESNEKVSFIKMSCYFGKEEYEKAGEFAEELKQSENEYYVYFATYADAYIARKLSEKEEAQSSIAEAKYNNSIAFFKNKSFEKPQDVFALIFRVRLYAEHGKFVKAEEMIKLLPDALRAELKKYINDCRAEIERR